MVLHGLLAAALVGADLAADRMGLRRIRPDGLGESRVAVAALDSLVKLVVVSEQLQEPSALARCRMALLNIDEPLDQFVRAGTRTSSAARTSSVSRTRYRSSTSFTV